MKINAFTLIELLIVIAIAAIIAGALIPLFSVFKEDAKVAKFVILVDVLRAACEQYYFDTGTYAEEYDNVPQNCPQSLRKFSCDSGVLGWNGPYLSHPLIDDDNPFGNRIIVSGRMMVPTDFDLDGDGISDRRGLGNVLNLLGVSEPIAKKIDDAIDKGLGGAAWKEKGKVRYNPEILNTVGIYLYGGQIP